MKLYQKHPKPLFQEPSKKLVDLSKYGSIPHMPIVDIACGYGRNGAYFASQGFPVHFIDMDDDCLDFISKGKNVAATGDIPVNKIRVLNMDLTYEWPFLEGSLGGIICVHFYFPGLIRKWLKSLTRSGFFYFESIDARSANARALPFQNEIMRELQAGFDVRFYRERNVKGSFVQNKVSCIAFAIKQ